MKRSTKSEGIGSGWAGELFVMFLFGFVLASMVWLGLWFIQAKPAHTAALEVKEAALEAKSAALEQCLGANQELNALRDRAQADNEELSAKLEKALAGWGRCIRSKQEPQEADGEGPSAGGN
jgi:uncharacterized membrane protein YccC